MPRIQTTGTCRACEGHFSAQAIRRHLSSCSKRAAGNESGLDLRVHAGPYWLYLEVSSRATLSDLDKELRRTWVECCDHLSAFTIAGTRYGADTRGSVALVRVARPGSKFTYEYDFGSTTLLEIDVVSERRAKTGKPTIRLLARNDPPKIPCSDSAECVPSKEICGQCGSALCAACAKAHECGEEMLLPLVNSPRAGVCGYAGSS
jgi:hypothetical protein